MRAVTIASAIGLAEKPAPAIGNASLAPVIAANVMPSQSPTMPAARVHRAVASVRSPHRVADQKAAAIMTAMPLCTASRWADRAMRGLVNRSTAAP